METDENERWREARELASLPDGRVVLRSSNQGGSNQGENAARAMGGDVCRWEKRRSAWIQGDAVSRGCSAFEVCRKVPIAAGGTVLQPPHPCATHARLSAHLPLHKPPPFVTKAAAFPRGLVVPIPIFARGDPRALRGASALAVGKQSKARGVCARERAASSLGVCVYPVGGAVHLHRLATVATVASSYT